MKRHSFMFTMVRLIIALVWLTSCRGPSTPLPVNPTPERATLPPPAPSVTAAPARPTVTPIPSPTPPPAPTPLPALAAPIRWVLRGEAPQDLALVNERLNRELALRGLNAEVELMVQPAYRLADPLATVEAGGAPFDLLAFPGAQYAALLDAGALLPLTDARTPAGREDLLVSAAPGLYAALPPAAWKAVRQNGAVYAVPTEDRWFQQWGVTIRADVLQALDLSAELAGAQTWQDLTPILARVQSALADGSLAALGVDRPDAIRRVLGQAELFRPEQAGYDPLALPLVVHYDDPALTVQNWYQTPEFRGMAELRQSWQAAGYLPTQPLTPEEMAAGYTAGQFLMAVGVPVGPGSAEARASRLGGAWVDFPLSPAFHPAAAPRAALTGLNARLAADPERARRALLLLELVQTDPALYNLLTHGIEGQHWTWADRDSQVIRRLPGAYPPPDFTGQIPGRSLAYGLEGQPQEVWDDLRRQNASAAPSAALGFLFDTRPAAAELAALQGILPEWLLPLANGQTTDIDRYLGRMNNALEAAGMPVLASELQGQLNLWVR